MLPLRIGLITTWNSVCGVAEYSRALAGALRARGHSVVILSSHPVNPVPGGSDGDAVYRFFYTGWHRERGAEADVVLRAVARHALDVLHLQYQNFIYPGEFLPVLRRLSACAPLVATFHDAGVPGEFPRERVARAIVHSPVTARLLSWPGTAVIPIGILDVPAPPVHRARARLGIASRHVLCSVGLGRTDVYPVLEAVRGLLPRYPDLLYVVLGPEDYARRVRQAAHEFGVAHHVQAHGGFFPLQTLFEWMHAADMTVFYFPETGVEGVSSSSCRLGIAARRPVIATDVGWTRDLPGDLKIPYGDLQALRERIIRIFEDPGFREALLGRQEWLIRETNWARTAERHEAVYRAVTKGPGRRSPAPPLPGESGRSPGAR